MSTELHESREQSPWSFIAAAAFLFAAAWWLHHVFTDLEQSGGSIRIQIIAALLYKVFGKWGIVGVFGTAGAIALYRGGRGLLQTPSAHEHTVRPPLSDAETARIDRRVDLVSGLIRNAPLLMTWVLLVYSVQELARYPALLPLTASRTAQSFYALWITLPFLLPAIFSIVFRANFIEAVGLFFATMAMTIMSVAIFTENISPSGRFASATSLVWVPVVQLAWSTALIRLLNRRRNERVT